jgi:hypothetical protein
MLSALPSPSLLQPMNDQTRDLFGFEPAQGDLFANEPARNDGVGIADPDDVRARLHKVLAEARAARSRLPWNERTTRMYQIVFPQMANWLPDSEAQQLCLAFQEELVRLGIAA